ncbi:unnamed protein product [Brachionus calyciflorus]|uniref:VWFA domain-containing protein n=1 Tax=Brachionus calyciflorus TaxID=104777 RepID=A0A813S763_9BILA|nr:unnamed protein product [Brachionus calyciflorus]
MNEFTSLPAPPPYEFYETKNLNREDRYRNIIQKHEISHEFSNRLQILQGFKVVFIFDDSGSMNTVLQDSPLNTSNNLFRATRWDELQYFARISIEIATLFDPNGCDVYFLNRKPSPLRQVKNYAQLEEYFRVKPNGFTPLARCLETVLADNSNRSLTESKLLIIIATDGEPTNDTGKSDVRNFKSILKSRDRNCYTTVVVCTDDEDSVGYLNRWDRTIRNLDVVDDFRNERNEIKKVKGHNYSFSFGDYVVKSLVGSIDPELDKMDENNCCNIL